MAPIKTKSTAPAISYAGSGSAGGGAKLWRGKSVYPWVMLLVCGLAIFVTSFSPGLRRFLGGAMQPLLAGARSGGEWVAEAFRGALPLSAMERRRLDALQERLHQLQLELTVVREAVAENHELRRALNLAPPAGWRRVSALVIARDPISWNRRFRINRGALDGVSAGNLVMVGDQAVGRVVEAAARTAMVATLLDPRCRLSVRLRDSRATGVLFGGHKRDPATGGEVAMIDFLPRDALYREAERVETSGLSGYVPGGIAVGRVVKWDDWRVAEIVDLSYARLKLAPAADLTDFRVVSVLVSDRGEPEN